MAGMNPQKALLMISASVVAWLAGCSSPSQEPTACLSSPALAGGLGSLPLLNEARTRSISAENLSGAKGQGGMAIPNPREAKPAASARAADDLGQGWKVKPFLRVNAGETVTLMDVDGPGVIQHIFHRRRRPVPDHLRHGHRGLLLRELWVCGAVYDGLHR